MPFPILYAIGVIAVRVVIAVAPIVVKVAVKAIPIVATKVVTKGTRCSKDGSENRGEKGQHTAEQIP